MKAEFAFWLLAALMLVQSAGAASGPITISYGRSWPLSLVVDSSRGLVFVDATSGIYPSIGYSFGVINASDHSLLKVLPLNVTPGAMTYDQSKGLLYIAGSDSIAVFDAGAMAFVRQIHFGGPILSMAFDDHVSPYIFIGSGSKVFAIDPATGNIAANATVGDGAGGMAIDPVTDRLYVADYLLPVLAVYQAPTLTRMGTIELPHCCAAQMALDPGTRTLYATTGTNSIDAVDLRSDTFVRSIQAASSAKNSTLAIALDNDTERAFVSAAPGGSIITLDVSNGRVLQVFRLGSQVAGMGLDTKSGELYATNYHQITVFDVRPDTVTPAPDYFAIAAVLVVSVALYYVVMKRREKDGRP